MQNTTNYDLPLYESTDDPNLVTGYNDAMTKVDAQIKANADAVASIPDPHQMITVSVAETADAATNLTTAEEMPEKGTVFAVTPNVEAAANPRGYMLQFGSAVSKALVRTHDTGEAAKIYTGAMAPAESYLIFFDGSEFQVLNATPSKASGAPEKAASDTILTVEQLANVKVSASGFLYV